MELSYNGRHFEDKQRAEHFERITNRIAQVTLLLTLLTYIAVRLW